MEKIKTIGSTYMAATGLNASPGPENTSQVGSSHKHTQTIFVKRVKAIGFHFQFIVGIPYTHTYFGGAHK